MALHLNFALHFHPFYYQRTSFSVAPTCLLGSWPRPQDPPPLEYNTTDATHALRAVDCSRKQLVSSRQTSTMSSSAPKKPAAPTAAALLLILLTPLRSSAMALPFFRQEHRAGGEMSGRKRKSETQIHSTIGLTIDDVEASGLWKMRASCESNYNGDDRSSFFKPNFKGRKKAKGQKAVPIGPVPRGGSLSDVAITSHAAASAAMEQPRQPLTRVRSGVRGVRRGIIRTALKMNQVRIGIRIGKRDGAHRATAEAALDCEDANDAVIASAITNGHSAASTNSNNGFSMLRGRLLKRQASRAAAAPAASVVVGAVSDGAVVAAGMGDIDAWSDMETIMQSVSSSVDGSAAISAETATATVTAKALSSRGGSSVGAAVADESAVKSSISTSSSSSSPSASMIEMETYVIETPLFPIVLPKAFEPPASAVSAPASSSAAASVTSLEISVALEEVVSTTASTADVAAAKPSEQLLQAATMPLLPKTLMESFTGRELCYPESIEALAATGIQMTRGQDHNEWINWSGEKKTDAFLRAHGANGKAASTREWYQALDASQEVLVWAGKSASRDGYGAELPIIKTTSIIRKSPKYLAELLMDSSKVKVYNKMSLGRTDERVFQTGV